MEKIMDKLKSRVERHLPKVREFFLYAVLFLWFFHHQFVPPFMVAGFLFAILHIAIHWRTINFQKWWPFLPSIGLYFAPLLYALCTGNPADAESVYILRVAYLMMPFLFFDIQPNSKWGSTIVISSTLALIMAWVIATIKSFYWIDGHLVFQFVSEPYWDQNIPSPWHAYRCGATQFYYSTFCNHVGTWPSYLGYGTLLSLIILLHRIFSPIKSRHRRLYIGIACFLLLTFFVINSRTNLLAGFIVLTLSLLYYILYNRRLSQRLKLSMLAVFLGVLILLSFTRLNFFAYENQKNISEFLEQDARFQFWKTLLEDRQTYIPFGIGPASVESYYRGLQPEITDPNVQLEKAHNEFFDTLVELGIPGFLYLIMVVILPFCLHKRFAPVHTLLWIPLLVLMNFETIGVMAHSMLCFAITYCYLWTFAITRRMDKFPQPVAPHL